MKKILIAIVIALATTLVACSPEAKDMKTSAEIIEGIKDLEEVQGLSNSRILGQSDLDIETVTNWLSDPEKQFELKGYLDGAVISPMMNVDARAVLILRFDGTEDSEAVKKAMENFSRFLICVQIENFEITNVGSTYIFSGVEDNEAVLEAFKALEFERTALNEESSITEVAIRFSEVSSIEFSAISRSYEDEMSMNELNYLVNTSLGIDTELIEEGFMSYSYDGNKLFAIYKTNDVDTLKEEVIKLNDFYKKALNSDVELVGDVVVYNNYVIYTNSTDLETLEEAIKSLN